MFFIQSPSFPRSRLFLKAQYHIFNDPHAGLDPASSNVTLLKYPGFRFKPGMTKQQQASFLSIKTQPVVRA